MVALVFFLLPLLEYHPVFLRRKNYIYRKKRQINSKVDEVGGCYYYYGLVFVLLGSFRLSLDPNLVSFFLLLPFSWGDWDEGWGLGISDFLAGSYYHVWR